MAESDEDNVLLEDDSMDEMHELEDHLVTSIDTNASPIKSNVTAARRRFEAGDEYEEKHGESDESELFDGSSSDESESSDSDMNKPSAQRIQKPSETTELVEASATRGRVDDGDEDDDEPPEIPGSPLRQMPGEGTGGISLANRDRNEQLKQKPPTADILTIRHGESDEEDEDYETKEAEAPRAMEFHTSSSSSDSERDHTDSDDDDGENNNRTPHPSSSLQREARQERPKTAAKELALYRDVMPAEYYEQIVQDAPSSPKKQVESAAASKSEERRQDQEQQREALLSNSLKATQRLATKYKVHVPREIESLFEFVDAFSPDVEDIPARLQPFIPEYVPAVGLPFDGIQIPRPDDKPDAAGIAFVREPCAQSNAAELELLLAARAKTQKRRRHLDSVERVHSIDNASSRPREIDNWIASVAKVQGSKPPPQVLYKKPMPSETALMELWPEEFEIFLNAQPQLQLGKMDLGLSDTVRVVCGVLDIPVYEGFQIHSLHALFSLYHEVVSYEKEMLGQASNSGQ